MSALAQAMATLAPAGGLVCLLALFAGCQSPEDGFTEAQDFDNVEAWREFIDRHGEQRDDPKVREGREILADRLLEACDEGEAGAAPKGCLRALWEELPQTRSGQKAATADGERALAQCGAPDAGGACLEEVASRFQGFDIGRTAANRAAQAQVSRCTRGDPSPDCYKAVSAAWEGTEAAAGADKVAELLKASGEDQAAWLREHPMASAAKILRGRLCLGRTVLVFDDAKREKLAGDGVAAMVRIRQAGGWGVQYGARGWASSAVPLVKRLTAAGCTVEHWTEPDVAVNIATGRKEVERGESSQTYRPSHKLKKAHRAKHDVVVWAHRVAAEHLKYSFGDPLKISFKRTTEVARRGEPKGRVVQDKWTFMETQKLAEPVRDRLAQKAADALRAQRARHDESVLRLVDAALADAAAPPEDDGALLMGPP